MEVIHECCAGPDVHKETVVACLWVRERGPDMPRGTALGNDLRGAPEARGLDPIGGLYARRDGSDWRLLEARLAHAGRRVRTTSG